MMLNLKRLFEKMCFKCTHEGWHTTTTPDLFWQFFPQTSPEWLASIVEGSGIIKAILLYFANSQVSLQWLFFFHWKGIDVINLL